MSETYGDLKLRVPGEEDEATGADVPASFRDYTDSLDAAFTGSKGQLLIAQEGAIAKWVAMKGDGTLGGDGTFSIGSGKVTLPKLKTTLNTASATANTEGVACSIANISPGLYICTGRVKATSVKSKAIVGLQATKGKTLINGVDGGIETGGTGWSTEVEVRNSSTVSESRPQSTVLTGIVEVLEKDTLSAYVFLPENNVLVRLTLWGIAST